MISGRDVMSSRTDTSASFNVGFTLVFELPSWHLEGDLLRGSESRCCAATQSDLLQGVVVQDAVTLDFEVDAR